MGNENAKPSDRLKYIEREVNSLRSSVRSSRRGLPKETKEGYIQNLVKLSNDASSLKGKVKQRNLELTQRNISNTMNEILTKTPQEADLDLGAVETSSFIHVPSNKRQAQGKSSSEKPVKKQKNQVDSARKGTSTLQEIEDKFKTLQPQIEVALENKDITQLRVHQETINVLVTDLEMIEVPEDTPIGDKKKKLDDSIVAQYQEIGKAMKEIRRNKDISYLMNQNKRDKAIKELDEIKKNLEEAESLLNYSLKNKDSSAMKKVREELIIINQRLLSIEIPDEKTKKVKMQLTEKIAWFYQRMSDPLETSNQTDLGKAQSNYEEIIKNVASGKNRDKEEIRVQLQSLQEFINGVKEDDEDSLRRKQQLLNNVKQSFSFILEDENKEKTTSSTAQKKPESGYKEVDGFYDIWKTIQKRIRSTTFPTEEVSKIDKVLEEIQKSIAQTRLQFSGHKNLQLDSTKKLNVSTPNLSPSKSPIPKFGSSLSIDSAGQSIIKTRAKVYDLTTPEVRNINDQPVVLRNKQFYKMNNEVAEDHRFSKIEEIKTQVNYIKEKLPESNQKLHLKNKLESYKNILEECTHHKNQAIANNAKLVLDDIQEMLKNMSKIQDAINTSVQRRLSVEESFENITGVQEAVDKIQKSVSSTTSRKDNYEYRRLKEELSYCKRCLEDTKIPPQYDMIQQQKDDLFKRINQLFVALQHKYEDSRLVKTREKLNDLKERVTRFQGAYKGVLYNTLEKDLTKILVDIGDSVDNKDAADEIIKEAEKHLKILEHRATKDQSFRRTLEERSPNENEERFAKLKCDLLDIKKGMDTTPTNAVNLFIGLRSRLDLVKLGLDQLKTHVEEEEKQKEVLHSEVESLKNVVEAKIGLARQSLRQWPLEQDRIKRDGEELAKIEEKFKSLRPEIENFVGTTSDNKFYELDEASIRLVLKMDKLQFSKGTENHTRKINLLKEIYNYGDILDQRAKETEDMIEVEREIYDIEKNFERYLRLNDVENLLDTISTLKKKIKNTETNKNLMSRKLNCEKKVDALFRKVTANEVKNSEGVILRRDFRDPAEQISKIQEKFSNLKAEIDSFVGIHADKKYYELERSLMTLFPLLDKIRLPEENELQPKKIKLLKEVHLYCDKLDKKAKETELANEITKQLNSVNTRVDDYKNTSEELKIMDAELKSIQTKLEKITISENLKKPLTQKFEILASEHSRLRMTKEPPKNNYIGSTSFLADVQNLNKPKVSPIKRGDLEQQMANIQRELRKIKRQVGAFVNSDASDEYKDLEEILLKMQLKISQLLIPREDELFKKQSELEKNVQECLNLLDERAQEVDNILEVENELKIISGKLENNLSVEEKNTVDEQLISLQIKVGKLQVNKDLIQRKNECANKIIIYLKQLKEEQLPDLQLNVEGNVPESFV